MAILFRVLGLFAVLLLYWALGWLNGVQAGKLALMGGLAIAAIAAWTTRDGAESRSGRLGNLLVFLPFLFIIVFQGFLRDVFGVAHDDALVTEAMFSTDTGEASEFFRHHATYLTRHLAVLLGLTAAFALLLRAVPGKKRGRRRIFVRPGEGKRRRRLAFFFTFLFLLVHLNPTMRKQDPLLYFPLRYMQWKERVEQVRALQEKIAAATASDPALASLRYAGEGPRTVVFVLGESVTRLNWSLYGYSRATTPRLEEVKGELVRFSDVLTSDGSTVRSIQKMLTPATLDHPSLWEEKPDLLTMAKKAGYKTYWITNHGTDATGVLSIFARHADRMIMTNRGGSRGEGSHDEVVLPHLKEALDDPAPLKFILVHLLGAHPAYTFRYPETFAHFDAKNDAVTQGLKEAGRAFWAIKLRNQYDNALLYGDHILRETLDFCRTRSGESIAWLFAPDHGEDVAHYTNFVGHNTRVLSMYEVPMLFWRSEGFPLRLDEARQAAARPYQMDALDHTLLGLMGIDGNYYNAGGDIFSPQFQSVSRVAAGKPYLPMDPSWKTARATSPPSTKGGAASDKRSAPVPRAAAPAPLLR